MDDLGQHSKNIFFTTIEHYSSDIKQKKTIHANVNNLPELTCVFHKLE